MLSELRKNKFVKQVSLLAGGTALAQVVNLAILPILTRLYTPEDFGLFAVMTATAALGGVVVSLRYENAILAVDTYSKSKLGVYSIFGVSLIMGALGVSLLSILSLIFNLNKQYYFIGIISILVMVASAWMQALYFFNNRKSNYREMTKGRVYAALVLASVSILWGGGVGSFWGLLLGSLFGMLTNLFYLFKISEDITLKEFVKERKNFIRFLVQYRRFPKFLVLSSLIDRAGSQGYILLFTKVYGESVSGALSLYSKVAGLPSVLIGSAIGDVFKRNASEKLRESGQCMSLFLKTAKSLLLLGILPFVILLFFGPSLFSLVFGSQWYTAGEYAQLLSPVFLLGFVVSPLSSLIYLEENQRYDLMLQMFLIIMLGLTLTLSIVFGDIYAAVGAYALAYTVKYLLEAFICWNIASGRRTLFG